MAQAQHKIRELFGALTRPDQPGCRKGFTISSGQRTARPGRSSEYRRVTRHSRQAATIAASQNDHPSSVRRWQRDACIALRACTQYNESTVRKPSGKRQVNLAIRLPLQKHRRFRAGVVEDGSSIQRVLENLIDRWIEERERGGSRIADLRGFLRGSDVLELRRAERQAELERDRSRL